MSHDRDAIGSPRQPLQIAAYLLHDRRRSNRAVEQRIAIADETSDPHLQAQNEVAEPADRDNREGQEREDDQLETRTQEERGEADDRINRETWVVPQHPALFAHCRPEAPGQLRRQCPRQRQQRPARHIAERWCGKRPGPAALGQHALARPARVPQADVYVCWRSSVVGVRVERRLANLDRCVQRRLEPPAEGLPERQEGLTPLLVSDAVYEQDAELAFRLGRGCCGLGVGVCHCRVVRSFAAQIRQPSARS